MAGETMETVTEFILGGSKISTDSDCSHYIKRHLLLASQVALVVKKLPANAGYIRDVGSIPDWEDPLVGKILLATHSSILVRRTP